MADRKRIDITWEETPIDVSSDVNFIWSIANKLRGSYMPDKYGDVIIPMTIIRRFECALEDTKEKVLAQFKANPAYPAKAMYRISGYQFYNTSDYSLQELCNDADNIAANFKQYILGFSSNVQDILNELGMGGSQGKSSHIDKMDNDGCLFSVVKAFSELDLNPKTFDSIRMGYIFEDLIGRFYQNVDAGQFYTGRDIIKMMVAVLTAEGCDDIFDEGKVITVCDQACGTGGMLSTAYDYLRHYNPSADVRLFGQEFMGQSYAVGLAEMLIKGQNADNFRHADTFKVDCFPTTKMRFLIENPPFGTPWSGENAKEGQEDAVRAEYAKGDKGRWQAGLPAGGDSQLIFLQSAVAKMDDKLGRAAIIQNGSSLFTGDTGSGESQVRRWLLEHDLIEAIIALPVDLFYNTGIATYIWVLSKNKRGERKGKVQLIDATSIYHKLRKPLGDKKNEITKDDRVKIAQLYAEFKENEKCKIFRNEEFKYREYTIMQPLQRSYAITPKRIENLAASDKLNSLYNEAKVIEWENSFGPLSDKDKKKLTEMQKNKPLYDAIFNALTASISDRVYYSPTEFLPVLNDVLVNVVTDKKLIDKIMAGLSVMDKKATIQRDRKGNIIFDTETKDIEIVKFEESIEDYMTREVLPYISDAVAFFEEKIDAKKPVIKTGAEIPLPRYFYKYTQPTPSSEIEAKFIELEHSVSQKITALFLEV